MKFIKYNSMENHYNEKFISKFLQEYPELKNETFIITEKIHGANFAVYIDYYGNVKFARRNGFLNKNENFFNYREAIDDCIDILREIAAGYLIEDDEYIIFYGELFGPGINKGVDYGNKIQYRVFDINIVCPDNIEKLTFNDMQFVTFGIKGARDLLVPKIAKVKGLDIALAFNSEFLTRINPKEGNICEGVVIRPVNEYYDKLGRRFILKKKNEKFLEKKSTPKQKNNIGQSEVNKLAEILDQYIVAPRFENIYSKFGRIKSKKDIGKYIGYVIEDIWEDASKEYEELSTIDKKIRKQINNIITRKIVKQLMNDLEI